MECVLCVFEVYMSSEFPNENLFFFPLVKIHFVVILWKFQRLGYDLFYFIFAMLVCVYGIPQLEYLRYEKVYEFSNFFVKILFRNASNVFFFQIEKADRIYSFNIMNDFFSFFNLSCFTRLIYYKSLLNNTREGNKKK